MRINLKTGRYFVAFLLLAVLAFVLARLLVKPPVLQVTWGQNGIEMIEYGSVFMNTKEHPQDQFRIGHMRVTDLHGQMLAKPADGWGENSSGKIWDPAKRTWSYKFDWGTIITSYTQSGDTLDVTVTENNRLDSGVILSGAVVYPMTLHFPTLPTGFAEARQPEMQFNTTGPGVVQADLDKTQVVSVIPDGSRPLYSGFWPAANNDEAYDVVLASTMPDGLATFQPHFDRPVKPGESDTFTLSLRFAKSGVSVSSIAADAFKNWASSHPDELKWPDRRIIGTAYLASAPASSSSSAIDQRNPRRYFATGQGSTLDIRNSEGTKALQTIVLKRASQIVENLGRLNSQGVITWDLEGQQYPQGISYVCSPDKIAEISPEMESTVTIESPYEGMKLDDAYFKTITSAGFRVGVCVRPQRFVREADGSATQMVLSSPEAEAEMLKKMRYAHDRWGVTLFYLDSNVDQNGAIMNSDVFSRLAAAFPDSLLIPEQSTPSYYARTAPLRSFLFHSEVGTGEGARAIYKHGFSSVLVNDVDPALLKVHESALTNSVVKGDILMVHADYWHPNNAAVVSMYNDAAHEKR